MRLLSSCVPWAAALLTAACGPSYRVLADGDAEYEHCYSMDHDGVSPGDVRLQCWLAWQQSYNAIEAPDKIQHARERIAELGQQRNAPSSGGAQARLDGPAGPQFPGGAPAQPSEGDPNAPAMQGGPSNVGAPPQIPPGAAPASTDPNASAPAAPVAITPSANAPAAPSAPATRAPNAAPLAPAASGTAPPGTGCSGSCREAWTACGGGCGQGDAACVARCDDSYRDCMRGCF